MSEKISTADIAQLLEGVPALLREQAAELHELREKVAAHAQFERAERLVEKMEERGSSVEGRSVKDKAASVLRSGRNLSTMEAALDMLPPSGETFRVGDLPSTSSNAKSAFEAAILGES